MERKLGSEGKLMGGSEEKRQEIKGESEWRGSIDNQRGGIGYEGGNKGSEGNEGRESNWKLEVGK